MDNTHFKQNNIFLQFAINQLNHIRYMEDRYGEISIKYNLFFKNMVNYYLSVNNRSVNNELFNNIYKTELENFLSPYFKDNNVFDNNSDIINFMDLEDIIFDTECSIYDFDKFIDFLNRILKSLYETTYTDSIYRRLDYGFEKIIDIILNNPDKKLSTYGTLAPGQANHYILEDLNGKWYKGKINGYLYKTQTYPAFISIPFDYNNIIKVDIFDSKDLPYFLPEIDNFEGVYYKRILGVVKIEDFKYIITNIYETTVI